MSNDLHCPDCGHQNDASASVCAACNFPLRPEAAGGAPAAAAKPTEAAKQAAAAKPAQPAKPDPSGPPDSEAAPAVVPSIEAIRPIRPRPPRAPQQTLQLQLWLALGGLAIAIVIYTAFTGFQKNNPQATQQVAGARQEQQQAAEVARAELARDSTNQNARIALANVLYDTGNWPEAIIHYKSAARTDSTRVETWVDMGVCYYNLSSGDEAVKLFKKALQLDPKQPVALFNLGVVAESQGRSAEALKYYHAAMQASPPDGMKQSLMEAMQRATKAAGAKAPDLGAPATPEKAPGF